MAANTRTSRRNIRLSPADDVLFQQAAALLGKSVSEFLIESGRDRATMVLADRIQLPLDQYAWNAFCAEPDCDAENNPAVMKLLQHPRPE
jgi:uncharacterized protein (DUF1778 family)